jgi:hypothetical protein
MTQEQELRKLQAAMKSAKRRRDFEWYQSVYLSLKGYTLPTLRAACGYDPPLYTGV